MAGTLETEDDVLDAFRGRIGSARPDGDLSEDGALPLSDDGDPALWPPETSGDGREAGTVRDGAADRPGGSPDENPGPPTVSGRTRLSRSYEIRETRFDAIDIDPPKGADFWELGDLALWVTPKDGPPQLVEDLVILRRYSERCASLPRSDLTGAEIVAALDFADSRLVARTVRAFHYGGGPAT